jgi:hypothetical protein
MVLAPGLVGILGYLGSWVAHPVVALAVQGADLAEYVKFIPPGKQGGLALPREVFLAPVVALSLTLSLTAGRGAIRPGVRVLLAAGAVAVALMMLPPAWGPATFRSAEFRPQTIMMALLVVAAVASPLLGQLPDRAVLIAVAVAAALAAVLPALAFRNVLPILELLFRRPVPIGWGPWVTIFAFGFQSGLAVLLAVRTTSRR